MFLSFFLKEKVMMSPTEANEWTDFSASLSLSPHITHTYTLFFSLLLDCRADRLQLWASSPPPQDGLY